MQGSKANKLTIKNTIIALLIVLGVLFSCLAGIVNAANLSNKTLMLSSSVQSAIGVIYSLDFNHINNDIIGSIELELCSNDPFPGEPCTAPVGLDFTASNITSQSGIAGLSIHPSSTANKLIFTRVPGLVASGAINITINNAVNPSILGSYFARLRTFASLNASGAVTDQGGLAFAITPLVNLQTEVGQSLFLCVAVNIPAYLCNNATGNYVNLGEFSSATTTTSTSQFVVGTNADFGFRVNLTGTTLTSGNNIIPPLAVQTASSPGTSQFGINLRQNNNPSVGQDPVGPGLAVPVATYNTPNLFRFVPGETLVNSGTVTDFKKFTVSYLVNIDTNQKPGIYNTTLLFDILATF